MSHPDRSSLYRKIFGEESIIDNAINTDDWRRRELEILQMPFINEEMRRYVHGLLPMLYERVFKPFKDGRIPSHWLNNACESVHTMYR